LPFPGHKGAVGIGWVLRSDGYELDVYRIVHKGLDDHADPVRAAEGPFGTTVARGFLTLSLLSPLLRSWSRFRGRRADNQLPPRPRALGRYLTSS
jgi:hypothetical protein